MHFSDNEWLRYTRHIQLSEIGTAGQLKLKKSHVMIIGMGGLGSPVSQYLSAAGVGTLSLIDDDVVELSNLQRQVIFSTEDIGKTKVGAAQEALAQLNPHILIHAINEKFNTETCHLIHSDIDLVIDCTDTMSARYAINDRCLKTKTAWLYASVHSFSGQCAFFTPDTACYRCLFPSQPEQAQDCNSSGILGVLPGILGTLQANEALKYLCGLHVPTIGHLVLFDAMDLNQQRIQTTRSSTCFCQTHSATDATPLKAEKSQKSSTPYIHAKAFMHQLAEKNITILDVRNDDERQGFHLNSQHIPLSELEWRYSELPKNQQILIYCQSGVRGEKACELLIEKGLDAVNLQGGIIAYIQQKLHVN